MATSIHSGEQQTTPSTIIQVPEYFYAVDINYLSHMISDMLGRLIIHNDLIPLTPANLTRFHSRIPPNITLSDYLRRIIKFTSIEKSCLLVILIYIDRVCERHPHFTISSLTVHRFLITAATLSSKALSDSYCTNSHYARIGGISTQELNALELEFLALIDWRLASTGVVLQQYYANLVNQHPCYQRTTSPVQPFQPSVTYNNNNNNNNSSSSSSNNKDGNTATENQEGIKRKDTKEKEDETNNKSRKRRRRRSSIKSTCSTSTLSEDSDDIWYDSDEDNDDDDDKQDSNKSSNDNNNDMNGTDDTTGNGDDSENQDETEVRRIWAHFDQLSETTWIPYIA